ncbi:hypothetical protein [Psychromicrobium xiongbiense]|uniref:hypothetical protein n=1 Tax=Psychromicrobium xiongbiense TaxID=3051184 RepID=UPI002556883E|nr:hypothetical protein [Psychromicrobium sp. YIM S02556]
MFTAAVTALSSVPSRTTTVDSAVFTAAGWFFAIAGIALIATSFLPKLKSGGRLLGIIVGVLIAGYGIYLELPTTTNGWFSLYFFILPVGLIIRNIAASVQGRKPPVQPMSHNPGGYVPGQNPSGYVPGQNPSGYQPGQMPQSGQAAPHGQAAPYGQPAQPGPADNQPGYGQAPQAPYGQQQPYVQQQPGQQPYVQPTDPTA